AAGAHQMAWHPDGGTLAAVDGTDRILLWDLGTLKQSLVLEGHRGGGTVVAFNHAGDLLASRSWDGTLRLWNPRTGRQLFRKPRYRVCLPRFSPDDRLLAGEVEGIRLQIWEVAAAREYRTLARNPARGKGPYYYGAISGDGRLLAFGMPEGFGLWDLKSGN